MMIIFSHQLIFLKSSPQATINASLVGKKKQNKIIRAPHYQYARGRYYNERWYTILYELQRDDTRNTAVVHKYTQKKKTKRRVKRKETEKKRKRK